MSGPSIHTELSQSVPRGTPCEPQSCATGLNGALPRFIHPPWRRIYPDVYLRGHTHGSVPG